MGDTKDRDSILLTFLMLVLLTSAITISSFAWASKTSQEKQGASKRTQQEDVDFLALAAIMVRDGHYDRAQSMLTRLSPDDEALDRKLFHTLQGLIFLHNKAYEKAIESFDAARANGQTDNIIHVYLAQCFFGLERWKDVIRQVNLVDLKEHEIEGLFFMKAQAHQALNDRQGAWVALSEGAHRFPRQAEFTRRKTYLLIELGLYQEAGRLGLSYLKRIEPRAADYMALALAFKKGRQLDRAKQFLEYAWLLFPEDEQVALHLAHTYIDTNHLRAAGDILQRASALHPRLSQEAAEAYRRAGSYQQALYVNAMLGDAYETQQEKFKQRVAIFLELERFEDIASMRTRLERLSLYEDQNVLYAVAYAMFRIGDLRGAEVYIKRISDPKIFGYATQLRRLIAVCKKNPEQCG